MAHASGPFLCVVARTDPPRRDCSGLVGALIHLYLLLLDAKRRNGLASVWLFRVVRCTGGAYIVTKYVLRDLHQRSAACFVLTTVCLRSRLSPYLSQLQTHLITSIRHVSHAVRGLLAQPTILRYRARRRSTIVRRLEVTSRRSDPATCPVAHLGTTTSVSCARRRISPQVRAKRTSGQRAVSRDDDSLCWRAFGEFPGFRVDAARKLSVFNHPDHRYHRDASVVGALGQLSGLAKRAGEPRGNVDGRSRGYLRGRSFASLAIPHSRLVRTIIPVSLAFAVDSI